MFSQNWTEVQMRHVLLFSSAPA